MGLEEPMGGRSVPIRTREICEQINLKDKNIPGAVSAFQILHCDNKEAVPLPVAGGCLWLQKQNLVRTSCPALNLPPLRPTHKPPPPLCALCWPQHRLWGSSEGRRLASENKVWTVLRVELPLLLAPCWGSRVNRGMKAAATYGERRAGAARGLWGICCFWCFLPCLVSLNVVQSPCPEEHAPCQYLRVGCRVVSP